MKSRNPAETYFSENDRILGKAIETGDVPTASKWMAELELSAPRRKDMTFLFFAMLHEQDAIVSKLLQAGADAKVVVPKLGSPLGVAARAKDSRWLKVFLDSGISPNVRDESALPIIFAAMEAPTIETLKTLHERGADLNATNSLDAPPLYEALSGQKYDHVEYLISAGANVQFSTVNGVTMGNAVERQLKRSKPETPLAQRLEKIKDLLEKRGFSFPADPIEEVRRKRIAAGLKVVQ